MAIRLWISGRNPANFLSLTGRSLSGYSMIDQRIFQFSLSRCFSVLVGANRKSAITPQVLKNLTIPDIVVFTNKINSYCKNRRLDDALQLFDEMPIRDAIAWNSMLKGCLDCGRLSAAQKLFDEMPERNVVAWTTMINGYFQFGQVDLASGLFTKMPTRDVTAWNSMLHGYCINGRIDDALKLFNKMPSRNVISWTSIMSGLDQNGRSFEALRLFEKMVSSSVKPTSSTLSCAITACGDDESLWKEGLQFHSLVLKSGYFLDEFVTTSLISFYSKYKKIEDSCKVFNQKKLQDSVVVWTSLLTAFGSNSKHEDALLTFRDMIVIGVLPNQSTFTSALNACCELEALDRAKEIHSASIKLGFSSDAFVGNSLIVLYSKCGSIKDGIKAFITIESKNLVSWNSIIYGSAQHGCMTLVLALFAQMVRANKDPDGFTLTGLLYACSHSGLLLKARSFLEYFDAYKGTEIRSEHYACMVDIMGRSGKLNEAKDFIQNMPIEATSTVWLSLLSACIVHSNFEVAEKTAQRIIDLDPFCSAAYIQLSNLYASAGKWGDVSRIRLEMKQRGIQARVNEQLGTYEMFTRGLILMAGASWSVDQILAVEIIRLIPQPLRPRKVKGERERERERKDSRESKLLFQDFPPILRWSYKRGPYCLMSLEHNRCTFFKY
ncbi:hypothetical protein V2J09_001761 [Rumex salicifolius]